MATYFLDFSDKRNTILAALLKQKKNTVYEYKSTDKIVPNKNTNLVFSPAKKFTTADLNALPNGVTLFCGNINEEGQSVLQNKKIKYFNFMNDELFVIENSALTAEGVLALVTEHTEKSIYENNILILGFGKLGRAIALLFSKLGLTYAVANYGETRFIEANAFTSQCYLGEQFLTNIHKYNVIINTIPAEIIGINSAAKISSGTLLLETASKNCVNPDYAKHFKYVPAPALPSKYSCTSAAGAMLKSIERSIQ